MKIFAELNTDTKAILQNIEATGVTVTLVVVCGQVGTLQTEGYELIQELSNIAGEKGFTCQFYKQDTVEKNITKTTGQNTLYILPSKLFERIAKNLGEWNKKFSRCIFNILDF